MPLPQKFAQIDSYTFDFAPSGRFTLLNRDGEDLFALSRALLNKLLAHTLWMAVWLIASSLHALFLYLFFVHLFLFCGRLTTLIIYGRVKAFFFPPLWESLSRKLEKGAGIELLKKHDLADHPGLLLNLARAQSFRNEQQEAEETLHKAQQILDAKESETYS